MGTILLSQSGTARRVFLGKKSYSICLIRGDGIGPEIIDATLKVLDGVCSKFGFSLDYAEVPGGDAALRQYGSALPQKSVECFARSDACLKGPVGETVMEINMKLLCIRPVCKSSTCNLLFRNYTPCSSTRHRFDYHKREFRRLLQGNRKRN